MLRRLLLIANLGLMATAVFLTASDVAAWRRSAGHHVQTSDGPTFGLLLIVAAVLVWGGLWSAGRLWNRRQD